MRPYIERVAGIAQLAPHLLLECCDMSLHFVVETLRPPTMHVRTARIGGDGETMRHRQLEDTHHLGQVGTFATEQVLQFLGRAAVFVIESIDIRHKRRV
jgi:hypothetical protein